MPRAIKVLRVKDEFILDQIPLYRGKAKAFLLDTYSEKKAGGTGKIFDWDIANKIKDYNIPVILAGGLTPSNIEEAIQRVMPYAVDVNSGIEESLGKKSHILMKELFERISFLRKRRES
jgi:phosphoribosylanthranilate isomerase